MNITKKISNIHIFLLALIVKFNIMFTINSIVQGVDTELHVQEPQPWNSNIFQISFTNTVNPKSFMVKLDEGRWHFIPVHSDINLSLEQLEINSIGYKIAARWTAQLKRQLDNFELSFS